MARKTKTLPIQVGTVIYNEKDRLPAWLKFWQPIAEQIIVIDQGSDDGTQKLLDESGVIWHERLPRGNADIHWNDLIGLANPNKPFFRLGVDEFITRGRLRKILKVMKSHPKTVLWWLRRINWIDGIDSCEHPEIKCRLGSDWQAIISFGRPYTFSGRMHGWPIIKVPGELTGYIGEDIGWIDHRRTLDEVISANESRQHMCRTNSANDQLWFIEVCKELISGNYPKEGEK